MEFYLSSYNYQKLNKLLFNASHEAVEAWKNAKAEKDYKYRLNAESHVRNEIDSLLQIDLRMKKAKEYLDQES
jgi:hypothetical protein